jgi:hypothetical protein
VSAYLSALDTDLSEISGLALLADKAAGSIIEKVVGSISTVSFSILLKKSSSAREFLLTILSTTDKSFSWARISSSDLVSSSWLYFYNPSAMTIRA